MTAGPALSLRDVRVTRGGLRAQMLLPPRGAEDGVVLDGVSFDLAPGEVLCVLGESGGGKSTIMRTVNRLVEVESGEVEVLGRSVTEWNVGELRRTAVNVPQRSFLFGGSVREELLLPQRWHGRPTLKLPLGDALERVQLDVDLDRSAQELSEGQRLRLCLARAMLLEPRILLLDEPTGALDVRTSRTVLSSLSAWAKEQPTTLLVVTHKPEDLETLGGDAIVLLGGRVAGRYSAADILARRVDPEVDAFLGAPQ